MTRASARSIPSGCVAAFIGILIIFHTPPFRPKRPTSLLRLHIRREGVGRIRLRSRM